MTRLVPARTAGPSQRAVERTAARFEVHEGLPDDRFQRSWEELAEATRATPWVRPGWLVPWWRSMGRGSPLVLVLRSSGGEMRAVLPLQRTRSGLASPTNWHTPEFAVVAEDAAARRELLQHAVERCGSRLTLDFVDPELAVELAAVAALRGGRSFSRLREASPYLILEPDWERGLDRHLLHEARRRGRRLAERGEVLFEVRDGTQDLDGLLEEGLRVEVSGWKGREGTAVSSSPDTLAFYRAVAGWAAERGLLRLAFLRLGGRPLAFDLGFEYEHVHYLLKSGYEEGERSLAPGKQLRLEALRDCARRGVVSYEFLGNADAWKQDWTELRRERLQTHAFPRGVAGARGWAMHARLLPAARVALTHLTRTGSALKTARPGLTQIGRA